MRTVIAAFMLASVVVTAQPITLGNANMPGSGDTLRYTIVKPGSEGNYLPGGPNRHWDFTAVQGAGEGVRAFKSALSTPYFFLFFGLNEYGEKLADTVIATPVAVTQFYNFYKKQTSPPAFIADGAGITLTGAPLPAYYTDKDELYKFPLTYPQRDSSTFRFAVATSSLIPVHYSKTGYRITEVDGWGSVTTPFGTDNCLRVVTTQYSTDSIGVTGFALPVPNFVRSYQWLTASSRIPFYEVTGNVVNGNFTPTQTRYRGYAKLSTGVGSLDAATTRIFPSPASTELTVVSDADGELSICDISGKVIATVCCQAGIAATIDVSALARGIYSVLSPNGTSALRFVKE